MEPPLEGQMMMSFLGLGRMGDTLPVGTLDDSLTIHRASVEIVNSKALPCKRSPQDQGQSRTGPC